MEGWLSGRKRRTRNAVCSKGHREFESHPLRQLGNEVIGLPAMRARQPFFGEISNRFEFNKAKSGLFLKKINKFVIIILQIKV